MQCIYNIMIWSKVKCTLHIESNHLLYLSHKYKAYHITNIKQKRYLNISIDKKIITIWAKKNKKVKLKFTSLSFQIAPE